MKLKNAYIGLTILLTGCVNPVTQFYQDYTAQMPVSAQKDFLPSSPQPRIIPVSASQYAAEAHSLLEQGYVVIGVSAFQGRQTATQNQVGILRENWRGSA